MEQWRSDLDKLERFREENLGTGLFSDPNHVHFSQMRRYRLDYVKTVKFNPKSSEFEPYDKRTGTFYNKETARKFISDNVKKNRKTKFLKELGTETPREDLSYLYAKQKLDYLKNAKNTSFWKIRNSFSTKIEGTNSTVYEQEWLQEIKEREAELLKLRAGTKYERDILKQLKAKRDAQ